MNWCCFDPSSAIKKDISHSQQDLSRFSSVENIKILSYKELSSATDDFHPSRKIGQGGFGTVYKGTLGNGSLVAAKVLSAESKQGTKEFLTEIDTITNVRHPNLVELIGCCIQGNNRILVYEYMEYSSLNHALLGSNSKVDKVNWSIRSSICLGAARGLTYLHEELEPPIVHRDIKASNILLDRSYTPKIGDFGLAKLFPDNITHISTCVAGTIGYLAPEYAMHGQLTKKADVYSFGVVVLEIVSGRSISRSISRGISEAPWSEMEKFLLEWAWELYEEGRLTELVDPRLEEYPEEEVLRYIKVALLCTQAASTRRPSMPQVVEMLSKPIRLNEKELTPPGLLRDSKGVHRVWKAEKTALKIKESTSINATAQFCSSPLSFTEIIPR